MRQLKITQNITNRDSKTLEKYFNDISKEDLLTAEEEVDLARRSREGDGKALEKLVRANLRFVVSVAKQYQHTKIPLNDLINEGNFGLVKAALRFDETRGFKFISYAVWWIRQSIIQALSSYARLIRIPANKLSALSKIDKATSSHQQEFEREPTEEELAEILHMTEEEIRNAVHAATKPISVDKPFEDGESSTLLDVIENKEANTVEDKWIAETSLKNDVEEVLSALTTKESTVLKMFFGIGYEYNFSLDDIGESLGISRERVRQIKERAVARLSRNPNSRLLAQYLG
ncbi:MAG: RNA polymerase sigma factor RpoD/SigA [Bacteroidota bacterium]